MYYDQVFLPGKSLLFRQQLVNMFEFESMLDLAEVIILGALNRTETRGSHFRTDFPKRDDKNWLKHTHVSWKDGGPHISYKDVNITKHKPMERKY